MNFEFTEEQMMLRESVARFLEQSYSFEQRKRIVHADRPFDPAIWSRLGELGLFALPFPQESGGFDGSIVETVMIAELFGRHLLAEPYWSSILLAGLALLRAGERQWLPRLISGEILGAFAHEEGAGTGDPAWITTRVNTVRGGYSLSGEKRLVLGGPDAGLVLVTARLDDGLCLVRVCPASPGVSSIGYRTIDGRRAANMRFDDVRFAEDAIVAKDAEALIRQVVGDAVVALSAEAVGAMGALLEATVSYAATRRQFGVAIGSFQAIAHRLADMKIAYVKARATLLYTTAMLEAGTAAPRDISLLKAQAGRLGRTLAESAVQIHGGVGMTDELSIGHYLKRIVAIEAMFGSTDHHLRVVGSG